MKNPTRTAQIVQVRAEDIEASMVIRQAVPSAMSPRPQNVVIDASPWQTVAFAGPYSGLMNWAERTWLGLFSPDELTVDAWPFWGGGATFHAFQNILHDSAVFIVVWVPMLDGDVEAVLTAHWPDELVDTQLVTEEKSR